MPIVDGSATMAMVMAIPPFDIVNSTANGSATMAMAMGQTAWIGRDLQGSASMPMTVSQTALGGVDYVGAATMALVFAHSRVAGGIQADGSATVALVLSQVARGELEKDYLTVTDVVNQLFTLWGIETVDLAAPWIREEAMNLVNATMQFLHARGKHLEFFAGVTRSYVLAAEQKSYPLESDVQTVTGPVSFIRTKIIIIELDDGPYQWQLDVTPVAYAGEYRLNLTINSITNTRVLTWNADANAIQSNFEGHSQLNPGDVTVTGTWPNFIITTNQSVGCDLTVQNDSGLKVEDCLLRSVPSRSQFAQVRTIYGIKDEAIPQYYYVDSTADVNAGERLALDIEVEPIGAGFPGGSLQACVQVEARRFTWTDYEKATALSIPNRYGESLFLPAVKQRGTTSQYFFKTTAKDAIAAEYETALAQFGISDPGNKEKSGGGE